ncbi:NAD(P)-dependent alcohol dehydrogenase [soil metagenome]
MKAIVRSEYGPPDVVELREIDRPSVGDGALLVRVGASSINQADLDYLTGRPLMTRMSTGLRKPKDRGLGLDVAGEVEAVGAHVTRFKPGDEVFGDMTEHGFGAFAEYVAAPERAFAPKPIGLTFDQAATVPQSAILALQGLRGFGRTAGQGQRVLVNGASGSVGPFAVQLAKARGAHVTGVCRTAKVDMVRSLGADQVIDYSAQDVTRGERYDWILDVAGNHSIRDWRRALEPGGTYVMVGGPAGRILAGLVAGPLLSLAGSRRSGLMLWWKPFRQEDVATLTEVLESGAVVPLIDRTFPLDDVADGLRYVQDGHARGKVVISV